MAAGLPVDHLRCAADRLGPGLQLDVPLGQEGGRSFGPLAYEMLQQEVLKMIFEKFGDLVVAAFPMFPREPKGLEGIREVAKHLVDGMTRVW
jgi:hypothetical protein